METFLKTASINPEKNCNCIAPFNLNDIKGINPKTGKPYTSKDKQIIKNTIYRISKNKNCKLNVCCDKATYSNIDEDFYNKFINTYPSVKILKKNANELSAILLSKSEKSGEGWMKPTPYIICKVSKSTISDTKNPIIKIASMLVKDCYTDSCDNLESIDLSKIIGSSKTFDFKYSSFDDARVTQAILEGNISYVKEYIRQYKVVDNALNNDDVRNRMLHIAAKSKHTKILELLLSLKPNVNVINARGDTPLHNACSQDLYDNAELLLKMGADVRIKNNDAETPIFNAIKVCNLSLLNLLYNGGSSLDDINKNKDTLLNLCIKDLSYHEDRIKVVNYLLDRGINVEVENVEGLTTLEIIKQHIDNEKLLNKSEGFEVVEHNINKISKNMVQLLEIQTLVFNTIVRSNPDKYNKYINVSEVPRGAPINIMNHVCVGEKNITGDEDLNQCIRKGGKIVKVKKPIYYD